jgi:hypothetical protein
MKTEAHMRTSVKTAVFFLILFVSGIAGAADSGKWEVLGRREVDFKNDRDQIDVGRSEGRFKQLQLRVKNAPIEISDMVVTFQNDETFRPKVRHRFEEGSGVKNIDLPGDRRAMKRIDFRYKSINRREGKGTVEVLGR